MRCKFILHFLLLSSLVFTSCINQKKSIYFQNSIDSLQHAAIPMAPFEEIRIQKKDVLYVNIQTLDPQSNALVSLSGSSASGSQAGPFSTYVVNNEGFVEFPLIGKLKLEGLTTSEAQKAMTGKFTEYYKNPIVNVRFAYINVSVVGEVNKPGLIQMTNERPTLFDAIASAGDLTIFGKRENVVLVREIDGQKKFVRFDLNSADVFRSPYYYLRQNDIIYVEPNKNRIRSSDVATVRTLSILSTLTTIVVVIVSRINF